MKTLSEMKSGLHRTQDSELFERTLNNDEIEALIDKARESALAIKKDKKRNKEEWIKTWEKSRNNYLSKWRKVCR